MKIVIILGIIVTVFVGILGISYVSAYNAANTSERGIVATYENNRNILSQFGLAVAEAAQIPAMQRDDMAELYSTVLDARYGEDGARAMFQMIQEQNPQLDPAVYTNIQRTIESGRRDFSAGQTQLLDRRRVYETQLGSFWTGTWMRVAGYPKINLNEYQIVSSERANSAFEHKIDEPIKLR